MYSFVHLIFLFIAIFLGNADRYPVLMECPQGKLYHMQKQVREGWEMYSFKLFLCLEMSLKRRNPEKQGNSGKGFGKEL